MRTWCLPPKADADFVWHMEDVLEVYQLPYDPAHPVVCLDEASKQLIGEVAIPVPARRKRAARIDYEYERKGTCNLFMMCEPLRGWRHVRVTDAGPGGTGPNASRNWWTSTIRRPRRSAW